MSERGTLVWADDGAQTVSRLVRLTAIVFGFGGLLLSVQMGTTLLWVFIGLALALIGLVGRLMVGVPRRPSGINLAAFSLAIFVNEWALVAPQVYLTVLTAAILCATASVVLRASACLSRLRAL